MGILGRPVRAVGAWAGEHPLRTAGGVGAIAAGAAMAVTLSGGGTVTEVTLSQFARFVAERPAYPALIAVGLTVLLFFDE